MKNIKVVILAAGKGSRLSPLTDNLHKSLIKFAEKPLLIHTLDSLFSLGFVDVNIVVGHMKDAIISEVKKSFTQKVNFIYNQRYNEDINSYSLYLGIHSTNQPTLIIESDVVVSMACWPIIGDVCQYNKSTWFTCDYFKPHQVGGIIKSDESNRIIDMQIVKSYKDSLHSYSKNLGIVFVSSDKMAIYKSVLAKAAADKETGYYMQYWIDNIDALACYEKNLYPNETGSFNTIKELNSCRESVSLA